MSESNFEQYGILMLAKDLDEGKVLIEFDDDRVKEVIVEAFATVSEREKREWIVEVQDEVVEHLEQSTYEHPNKFCENDSHGEYPYVHDDNVTIGQMSEWSVDVSDLAEMDCVQEHDATATLITEAAEIIKEKVA